MITARGYQIITVICISTCVFGSNCILFSPVTKRTFTHPLLVLRCRVQAVIISAYGVFMVYRTVEVKIRQPENFHDFNLSSGMTLCMIMASVAYTVEFFNPEECVLVMSQLFRFAEEYRKKWVLNFDPKNVMSGYFLERLMLAISTITLVGSLIGSVPYFIDPYLPVYLPTVFPEAVANHWVVYWGFGLLLIGGTYVIMGLFWVLGSTGAAFFCCAVPILRTELRPDQQKYITKGSLRHHAKLPLFYRQLEILHKSGIRIMGKVILPIQFLIGKYILIGNFTLVRDGKFITTADFIRIASFVLTFQVIWLVTLELSGLYYKYSVATLRSWKYLKVFRKESRKYISKFRKSCRPLCIGTEGYFMIRRLTVLKFLRAIIRGTFRALLTAKGYNSRN